MRFFALYPLKSRVKEASDSAARVYHLLGMMGNYHVGEYEMDMAISVIEVKLKFFTLRLAPFVRERRHCEHSNTSV